MESGSGDERRSNQSLTRRLGMQFQAPTFLPAPISTMLELSGLMRSQRSAESEASSHGNSSSETRRGSGEVSIRIDRGEPEQEDAAVGVSRGSDTVVDVPGGGLTSLLTQRRDPAAEVGRSLNAEERGEGSEGTGGRDAAGGATAARYDLQQAAKWVEQALPFALLLLMVFIREHMQGFLLSCWLTGVLIKCNDAVKRQTALKGERRGLVLLGLVGVLSAHTAAAYWWYRGDDLWRPLALMPLRTIPSFWQAMWIIVTNDILVRYVGMVVKCFFLATNKKSVRGRHFRQQAQLLTLVEYSALFYRALIPAPVWYRFFLNEAYGHLFSSLTTGLYLTFKLTATFDKVCSVVAAVRQVTRKEVQYGQHATPEEVVAAGDMCAICQEKMHAPISLRCHHVFCEDCVSEWFERERTCPLCRAVVKAAGLHSFGDGSTNLLVQLF